MVARTAKREHRMRVHAMLHPVRKENIVCGESEERQPHAGTRHILTVSTGRSRLARSSDDLICKH